MLNNMLEVPGNIGKGKNMTFRYLNYLDKFIKQEWFGEVFNYYKCITTFRCSLLANRCYYIFYILPHFKVGIKTVLHNKKICNNGFESKKKKKSLSWCR